MKYFIRFAILIGLLSISQLTYSDSITDTYNTGDTLTATMLNNIKSAVNDNDSRMDSLEAADLINRITALENALAAHIANLANPHVVTKAQIGLADLENIRVNYTATIAPTVNDDINSGYSVGSVWIDVTEDQVYVSVDSTSGLAVWKAVTNKFYKVGDTGPAGGIVFYITSSGAHGLEAAPVDQSAGAEWGCIGTAVGTSVQEAGDIIGAGATNTAKILAGCPTPGIAARLADNYSLNGYSDWYLPSTRELEQLWQQRNVVGGFSIGGYWSSQETEAADRAWTVNFLAEGTNGDGGNELVDKNLTRRVRAIRSF